MKCPMCQTEMDPTPSTWNYPNCNTWTCPNCRHVEPETLSGRLDTPQENLPQYEAVIMDVANGKTHQAAGDSIVTVLTDAIKAFHNGREMSLDELERYRFSHTADTRLEKLIHLRDAIRRLASHRVRLLVVVALDQSYNVATPIGFVRRIPGPDPVPRAAIY